MPVDENMFNITTEMHVRCIAHAFHATCGDNILIPGEDALGGKHDRLHATGTDLVDSGGIGPMLHPGSKGDLASGGLTNSGLDDITEENLFDLLWRDVVLVKRVF